MAETAVFDAQRRIVAPRSISAVAKIRHVWGLSPGSS